MSCAIDDLLSIIASHFIFSANKCKVQKSRRATLRITSLKKEIDNLLGELEKNVCTKMSIFYHFENFNCILIILGNYFRPMFET